MTKVPSRRAIRALIVAASMFPGAALCAAQTKSGNIQDNGQAAKLYQQLGSVGLDAGRAYHIRGASIDRPGVQLTLEDGTIAFTQDVMGKITGAFFEGEGEVLIAPPNEAERQSMSLFTGMAILEERFATAYLRFNDNTAAELGPGLRATEDSAEFCERWKDVATSLAQADAFRLLLDFSRGLKSSHGDEGLSTDPRDQFLHARLQGTKVGIFDVVYDASGGEPVEVGQARKSADGSLFYDVWTSFVPGSIKRDVPLHDGTPGPIDIVDISIKAHVKPPTQIEAEAVLKVKATQSGERALMFELSRFIRVDGVERDGGAVEFIHNPSIEGTELARRGNDVVAVILDRPSEAGQVLSLRFVYHGEVLADAGPGLVYVGARGNWYPNRGPEMANYDLQFYYPEGWTLVATGKPVAAVASAVASQEQVARWVSDRPIPVAGFNLGKYRRATAHAGTVLVESYGAAEVERNFPKAAPEVTDPNILAPGVFQSPIGQLPAPVPSPAMNTQMVADAAATAIRFYSERFGAFPYSQLALTQLPGPESQGWPGLIFLSSYAFLTEREREALHKGDISKILERQIAAHETAHQWWGDLITWRNYRDQWISEALANYCSLMELEAKNPSAFRRLLDDYRVQLSKKSISGRDIGSVGPVTLGLRLSSSQSPEAYEPTIYGRGTWLIHMLRMMLRDASRKKGVPDGKPGDGRFEQALLLFRNRYAGKAASTAELLAAFEENMPAELKFEGKNSLEWFMHSWIEGTAMPRLSLHSVKFAAKGNQVEIRGVIQQKDAPADLITLVPIYGGSAGKSPVFLGQVFADGDETAFQLLAPAGTARLVVDPDRTILTAPR